MGWQDFFSFGDTLGGFGSPQVMGESSSPFGEDAQAFNSVLDEQTKAQIAQPEKAGGSIMFKILSGALLGLGSAAGAPDPGTAFAQGYQAIEQKREKERLLIKEQKDMERQDRIFDAQMMEHNMRKIEFEQKMSEAPERLRREKEQLFYQKMEAFDKMGREYVNSVSEDAIGGYLESLKEGGENLAKLSWEKGPDGQVHIWRQNRDKDIYPEGFMHPKLGNIGGRTVEEVDKMEFKMFEHDLEMERVNAQGRWGVKEANIRAAATGGAEGTPKETPEQRQKREMIGDYMDQIKMLRGENAKGVPGENQKNREARLAANNSQIDLLTQEINKLMTAPPSGTENPPPTNPVPTNADWNHPNVKLGETVQYQGQPLKIGQKTPSGVYFMGLNEKGQPVGTTAPPPKMLDGQKVRDLGPDPGLGDTFKSIKEGAKKRGDAQLTQRVKGFIASFPKKDAEWLVAYALKVNGEDFAREVKLQLGL